jgi:hypothetical protein
MLVADRNAMLCAASATGAGRESYCSAGEKRGVKWRLSYMPTRDEWLRVLYHEAGHAVVSLAVANLPARIDVRCVSQGGTLRAEGTYDIQIGLQFNFPGAPPVGPQPTPKSQVMMCAAGGVAEEIRFGNHSAGVAHDRYQIDRIILITRNGAARMERDNDYADTRALLQGQWNPVCRIVEIALRRLYKVIAPGDAGFNDTQILSREAVRRIYENDALNPGEYAQAQLGAYYYSLLRGNGQLPSFDEVCAREDFERSAGDVIGNTAAP